MVQTHLPRSLPNFRVRRGVRKGLSTCNAIRRLETEPAQTAGASFWPLPVRVCFSRYDGMVIQL